MASVTRKDIIDCFDMNECVMISASPNRPNIFYAVCKRTTIDEDMGHIVKDVKINNLKSNRIIVYCRSLNMCAELYALCSLFVYTG